jgi:hypothetical protein
MSTAVQTAIAGVMLDAHTGLSLMLRQRRTQAMRPRTTHAHHLKAYVWGINSCATHGETTIRMQGMGLEMRGLLREQMRSLPFHRLCLTAAQAQRCCLRALLACLAIRVRFANWMP